MDFEAYLCKSPTLNSFVVTCDELFFVGTADSPAALLPEMHTPKVLNTLSAAGRAVELSLLIRFSA